MAAINMHLSPEKHHNQENLNISHPVTINDQLLARVNRDESTGDEYSPTPEGVHQDNTEISSVTLVGRQNVTHGGESRLWSLDTPTGNYDEDKFRSGIMGTQLKMDYALQGPWETIYFNDRKLKHEARPFYGPGGTTRDVIINFTRKPLLDGTDVKLELEEFVPI